jgi:hypothetical protein
MEDEDENPCNGRDSNAGGRGYDDDGRDSNPGGRGYDEDDGSDTVVEDNDEDIWHRQIYVSVSYWWWSNFSATDVYFVCVLMVGILVEMCTSSWKANAAH